VGGDKALRRRPIISAVECPLSPMVFEKGLSEAQVTYAKAGIPVVSMVANLAGLTSPVTLTGTIAQTNAENLASLVISQVAQKGAPWIYSSDSVPADLKTGSIDYGAFEAQLLRTGAGQMGRYYKLPVMCAGIGIEDTSLILGTIQEGVPYMINQALVPSDLGSGLGGVDQAAGASFEQIIVDAWIWDIAKEIIREFESDEEAISFETVKEASVDGSFLTKKHTMTRFRKEFMATTKPAAVLSGRGDCGARGSVIRKAQEEAKKILKKEKTPVVPKDIFKEMDDLIRKLN
jgi:trimethylamine--corrinoid protein Co-methyltransferase